MQIQRIDSVSFNRKPNQQEMKVYTKSLNQGLELLGKQIDVILHNASAPAVKSENTGIGSLFSKTTSEKLLPFLKAHAFSHIQQEPNGLRQMKDNSPYAPESNARNIFMIPLEKLASDEYGNILSKKTFNEIVKNNPHRNSVDYNYVRKSYEKALREAYTNSKDSKELAEYKKNANETLEANALFRVLSKINNESAPRNWNRIDRELYQNKNSAQSQARISELKTKYKDEYDYFLFQQMILEKENKASNKLAKEIGITIIGDSPVASTSVENWINKDLFLKGKAIGCPPDYFSPKGQRWGFPYYNPDKIFNKDGSLGEAGKILQKKYEDYFANFPGGIRIDHVIGLVDPFIYTKASQKMTTKNSGRIYSQEGSKYKKNSVEEYAALFNKIIIPAAEKYGLNKASIICEDLGDTNIPTEKVMKKLDLSGLAVTQFDHRGADTPSKNTIMLGSHDNQSYLEFVDDLFNYANDNTKKERFLKKTQLLAQDTAPKNATKKEIKNYTKKIRNSKKEFISASFAELFTSPAKRIQIFFADFWGLGKTYNTPGTKKGNWSLRLSDNFENEYYQKASKGKAPNLPALVARALKQRGLDKNNEQLMQDLDKSAKIIDEKI